MLVFISIAGYSQNKDSLMVKKIVDETTTNGTAYSKYSKVVVLTHVEAMYDVRCNISKPKL